MRREFYFIRHGETDYNRKKIIQGSGIDSSLNAIGLEQATRFYDRYKSVPFDIIYTSNLIRTQQTVHHFIDKGIIHEKWPQLNEINWGIYEGKSSTPEMHEVYVSLIKSWEEQDYTAKIQNGESAKELGDRLSVFLDHLKSTIHEKVLICSHGRSLKALISLVQYGSLKGMNEHQFKNTGLTKVELIQDSFNLLHVNDLSHLKMNVL